MSPQYTQQVKAFGGKTYDLSLILRIHMMEVNLYKLSSDLYMSFMAPMYICKYTHTERERLNLYIYI